MLRRDFVAYLSASQLLAGFVKYQFDHHAEQQSGSSTSHHAHMEEIYDRTTEGAGN